MVMLAVIVCLINKIDYLRVSVILYIRKFVRLPEKRSCLKRSTFKKISKELKNLNYSVLIEAD